MTPSELLDSQVRGWVAAFGHAFQPGPGFHSRRPLREPRAPSAACSPRFPRPPSCEYRDVDGQIQAGALVPREHGPEIQPTKIGRGQGKYYDPFYAFEQIARYHGEPPPPPEPKKGALLAVEMLTSKAAVVVMGCVLAVVVFGFLMVLVIRG